MAWAKKLLSQYNRNGDPQQVMVYANGMETVPVVALLNGAGDVSAPATEAAQTVTNGYMQTMSGAMIAMAGSMAGVTSNTAATLETRVKAGTAYIASVGKLTLSLGILNMKATIENPSGSGKTLYVYALEVAQDGLALAWPSLLLNPTTNKPGGTAGTSKFNQNPGSANTTVALIKSAVEASTMSGGTDLGAIPIPTGRQVYRDHIYVLPPGTTLGMNLVGSIGLNGMIRAFYWEEPV